MPLFAVVMRRGRVISVHTCDQASGAIRLPARRRGRRSKICRSAAAVLRQRGVTRHAERAAVQEIVRRNLTGATVVLFRLHRSPQESGTGALQCALPCSDCAAMLFASGLAAAYKIRVVAHDGADFREVDRQWRGSPSSARRSAGW